MVLKEAPSLLKKAAPPSKGAYWGYHLILDCKHCVAEKMKSENNIRSFVQTLIPAIDMKAYGEPLLAHFATHNPHAAGYSLVQLIETSSITAHFAENIGELYLDIFSCKSFDIEVVKTLVTRFFQPKQMKDTFLIRQA